MTNNLDRLIGPEQLPAEWPWRVLLFSFILLLIAALSYVGFVFGYEPSLDAQVAEKDREITALSQTISASEQEVLVKFYSQLANLQGILQGHVFSSRVFPILEKYANQKVYYKSSDLNISTGELALDGVAQSYEILAQQLEAYKQASEIERFVINQAELQQNLVNFRVVLFFKKNTFK